MEGICYGSSHRISELLAFVVKEVIVFECEVCLLPTLQTPVFTFHLHMVVLFFFTHFTYFFYYFSGQTSLSS